MPWLSVAEGLRGWAAGSLPVEAAVELLIRSGGGRFTSPDWLWIREGSRPGSYWLDSDALVASLGSCSGGEWRVLTVVHALATSSPVDVVDVLTGVDRPHLELIVAAFAHAAGSHQQVQVTVTRDGYRHDRLPPMVAWPADPADPAELAGVHGDGR